MTVTRPNATGWSLALMLAVCAFFPQIAGLLGAHRAGGSTGRLDAGVMALFGVPALWLAAWLVRARIVADERGLRWRGLGQWRTAQWADVSDFYERSLPNGKTEAVIETRGGKVTFGAGAWNDNSTLRGLVEQNAVNVRARTWQTLGLRPELDWPRAFHYRTGDNKVMGVCFAVLALALVAEGMMGTRGGAFSLWTLGALLLGCGPLLLFVCVLVVPRLRDTARRKRQSVTVRLDGIMFTDGERTVAAAWGDIAAYSVVRKGFASLCVVETKHGTWDFAPTISESGILCKAIEQHATAAPQSGWRVPDDENLARRWSSGCEGVGERVFHYRTRTNRAMLWLPTAVLLVAALLTSASWGLWGWAFWLLYALPTAWGWARYFGASVRVGDGLTQHTVFGPCRLAWADIDNFYLSGDDAFVFGNVTGAGKRIRFWVGISDAEKLKQEIARRAVHSRRSTWEKAGTPGNDAAFT